MEKITLNYDESIEVVNGTLDTIKYFDGVLEYSGACHLT